MSPSVSSPGPELLAPAGDWLCAKAAVANGAVHNNFNNGLRCLPVNGWAAAFHRQDGKHRIDPVLDLKRMRK